jgi:hypothetical protein
MFRLAVGDFNRNVVVDLIKGRWRWTIYAPGWDNVVADSPSWHSTSGAAIRSAWAYMRKEAKKI